MPERMDLTWVESRRPSVISQPCESSSVGNPRAVLSPERAAAARPPTPTPISPLATVLGEGGQPHHGEETRSCEPDRVLVAQGSTPQLMSEAAPDAALDAGLDTALGSDHHENDQGRPEPVNQSHLDIVDDATADVVTSVPHQAEIATVKGCGRVEDGPPADPSGAATVPESTQSPSTHAPRTRPAK